MKNYKRAKRRKDEWKKVRKRTSYWGEYRHWMKDTSTPCSCSMCSYPKYERKPSQYIQKDINEQIEDYGYNEETHICEKRTPENGKTDLS